MCMCVWQELEDKILKLLKEAKGNILDDEVLINTLNNSKLTAGMIQNRVREAEETENSINQVHIFSQYLPPCFASLLALVKGLPICMVFKPCLRRLTHSLIISPTSCICEVSQLQMLCSCVPYCICSVLMQADT